MASGGAPKIVHKQFNSPIGLYSQQNIQATLNKHIKHLDNGAQGIDFNANQNKDKLPNLANSAVLRMLEEEERQKNGLPNAKKVVWPPTGGNNGYIDQTQQNPSYAFNNGSAPAPKPAWQNQNYQTAAPQQYQRPTQQVVTPTQKYVSELDSQKHNPNNFVKLQPASCEGRRQETAGIHRLIPVAPGSSVRSNSSYSPVSPRSQKSTQPGVSPTQQYIHELESPYRNQSTGYTPQYNSNPSSLVKLHSSVSEGLRQEPAAINRLIPVGQSNYNTLPSRWAPSNSSYSPQQLSPNYSSQSQQPPYHSFQEQYNQETSKDGRVTSEQYTATQQYAQTTPGPFSPPGSSVSLRPFAPIHQKPSPIFSSQPAAASYQGGPHMRGDKKWPPQSVREAVQAENDARIQLARGPACRPRRINRDYTEFFAKNAVNNSYVGYKVPPGTQHFNDYSGQSSY